MRFVRGGVSLSQLSTKIFRSSPVHSLSTLWLRGSAACVFSFKLHPASRREKGRPRAVKVAGGDPRLDHAILKLQLPMHV
ncbi:hypothetical protein TNCV_4646091 [Trichonephila clavipes]|nr:hypothetical protein TNCV_4646091 [Trichonephila clavipes]